MSYCQKCSIEYPEDKKFCKKCGSSLIIKEPSPLPKEQTIGVLETEVAAIKIPDHSKKWCSACGIEYPSFKKFCKACGSALTDMAGDSPMKEADDAPTQTPQTTQPSLADLEEPSEKSQKKYCPSCGGEQETYQRFCKTCGFSLPAKTEAETPQLTSPKPSSDAKFESTPPKPTVAPALGVPSRFKINSLLRKKKKLLKMGGKVTILITNLGAQRGVISDNALNAAIKPYEMKLEGIREEIREIDSYLNDLQKNMGTESENLEKEILPYKNRLDELKTMRKAKGLTWGDYKRFKKEPFKVFKHLGSQIKKRQKLLRLLNAPTSKATFSHNSSIYLKIVGLVFFIVIIGAGGFIGYKYYFNQVNYVYVWVDQISKFLTFTKQPPPPQPTPSEGEIKKVFETIKQANINEDINLFMTCYSTAFPNLKEKKEKTIQTWKDMDITDLTYTMRDLIVQQNTAEVTIDWQITTLDNGQTETFNTTNNVVLQKEGDQWKIVKLR